MHLHHKISITLDYRFKVKTVLLNSIKSTQLNTINFN